MCDRRLSTGKDSVYGRLGRCLTVKSLWQVWCCRTISQQDIHLHIHSAVDSGVFSGQCHASSPASTGLHWLIDPQMPLFHPRLLKTRWTFTCSSLGLSGALWYDCGGPGKMIRPALLPLSPQKGASSWLRSCTVKCSTIRLDVRRRESDRRHYPSKLSFSLAKDRKDGPGKAQHITDAACVFEKASTASRGMGLSDGCATGSLTFQCLRT
jgi:hypothetical protein